MVPCREDDVSKATKVKEIILNDLWRDQVDYIISFTTPIYDMLRVLDTDRPTLHLVHFTGCMGCGIQ